MTQEEIQKQALEALITNNGIGVCEMQTGSGKSKVLIDFITTQLHAGDTVLLTVPLSTLINNWIEEFVKWTTFSRRFLEEDLSVLNIPVKDGTIVVTISTIQTAYKWSDRQFTLLAVDEIHTTVSEQYSNIFENQKTKYVIGLTATSDVKRRPDKQSIYDKYCPIVYSFKDGEEHGIVNKTQFKIVEHTLDDTFRVKVGPKHRQWLVGEAAQYKYLSQQIKLGQMEMSRAGSSNFFSDASEWFWKKKGDKQQAEAGRKYLGSITNRRKFLLSLQSSAEIAKRLAKQIILENDHNKVLVFSEQVEQLKKICLYNVFGEQLPKERNKELISNFNDGSIRALGSVNSLGMGINLIGANNAIFESYNSSNTKTIQKVGRLHRLNINDTATIYFINIRGTQVEQWLEAMLPENRVQDLEILQSSWILK